jgi:hypothetical protein
MIPLLPSADVSLYSILKSGVLLLRIKFGVRSPSTDWVAKATNTATVIILKFIIFVYVYLYGFIIYIG